MNSLYSQCFTTPLPQAVAKESLQMYEQFLPQQLRAACSHRQRQGTPRLAEKAENYTHRVSVTAEGEVVTAAGLSDAGLQPTQHCLALRVSLQ